MTAYIIKSSVSLIILFGLYWLLLRKEKLFVFNRFFLIAAIVFSLLLPFITIPVNFRIAPQIGNFTATGNFAVTTAGVSSPEYNIAHQVPISISIVLLVLYFSGAAIFLFRFLRNIFLIVRRRKNSEKVIYNGYLIILTEDGTGPCCFCSCIFLNKKDYLNGKIARELIEHEIEHARQHHTADIIFIELLKIFYWFNPVTLLYERAIRINHEYLADNSVINDKYDIQVYADKLLKFVTVEGDMLLTSGSNTSFVKMRLMMMAKSASGKFVSRSRIIIVAFSASAFMLFMSFKKSDILPLRQNLSETRIKMAGDTIKGFVLTEDGKPLTGVRICVVGNQVTTFSREDGSFRIEGVKKGETLEFIHSGFKTSYITQTGGKDFPSELSVKLKADIISKPKKIPGKPVKPAEPAGNPIISPSRVNILYLGFDNPVDIAVPGVAPDRITATMTNGTIRKTDNSWIARPEYLTESSITIYVDEKAVAEKNFKIKAVPKPVAVFAGKTTGSISKDIALNTCVLEAVVPDFEWDLKFEIVSFTMLLTGQHVQSEFTEYSTNNLLTDKMKSMLASIQRGHEVIFKDIRCKLPDGTIHDLSPIILKLD